MIAEVSPIVCPRAGEARQWPWIKGEGECLPSDSNGAFRNRMLRQGIARLTRFCRDNRSSASLGVICLPDVDPRTIAAAGEKTAEGSGLGEGTRVGKTGEAGRAALRLCSLVAQSP